MKIQLGWVSKLAILALAGTAFGQQANTATPSPAPVAGKPASLSIVVQDKHHHPQAGINKDELVLLEDSKPQAIQSTAWLAGGHEQAPGGGARSGKKS
jgi:hypothetical protein